MAIRHCRVCGDWHNLNAPWPSECAAHFGAPVKRSGLPIRDGMEPTRSMIDGSTHDSKRAYERHVREHGFVIAGNDREPFDKRPTFEPEGVGESIKQAIEQLESGTACPIP
jgi:hypothetical protein